MVRGASVIQIWMGFPGAAESKGEHEEACDMGERIRRRLVGALAAATMALMLSPQLGALSRLPDEMVLGAGTVTEIPVASALSADATGDAGSSRGWTAAVR